MMKLKLQRHDVDRSRSRVGKIKGSMWVGSEAEVGELGAGFGEGDTRKLTWLGLVTRCGQGSGWDHPPNNKR